VATKEASGNISAIAEIAAEVPELDIYSGNDDQIVPLLALGAKGVISVLSNVVPKETHDIVALWMEGKVKESAKLQLDLLKLANTLFCEVNPVPVKAAMAHMGFTENLLRSPLFPMEEANEEKLLKNMRAQGINV
jgi:4-hydroxy-tetrahydrodipicolinate synthase